MFWVNFYKNEKPYFFCYPQKEIYNMCKVFLEDKDGRILDIKTKEVVAEDKFSLLGKVIKSNTAIRYKKSKEVARDLFGHEREDLVKYEVVNGVELFWGSINYPWNDETIYFSTALSREDFLRSYLHPFIEEGYGILSVCGYIPKNTKFTMRDEYAMAKQYVPIGILNHIPSLK